MINYSFGEILLLRFPYSEGVGEAKRPTVVLTQTDLQDIVVAKITSAEQRGKYDIVVTDWQKRGLLFPSVIRIDKLATLSTSRVIKELGVLGEAYHSLIREKIKQMFGIV